MDGRPGPGGPAADDDRWCDLACPWAEFPDDVAVDGSLSCRTFRALYCRQLKRLVPQNARCAARRAAPDAAPPPDRN